MTTETKPETITIELTAWEVTSLSAWFDVTEPDHCGGEAGDDDHDEDGHSTSDTCMGYCPGDSADLHSIGDKMMRAAREAGW